MSKKKRLATQALAFVNGDEHTIKQLMNRVNWQAYIRKLVNKDGQFLVRVHDDRSLVVARSAVFDTEEERDEVYDAVIKQMGHNPPKQELDDDFFGELEDDFFGPDEEDEDDLFGDNFFGELDDDFFN